MNAVEYFKSYGLSEAKRILRDARGCASVRLYDKYNFSTDDLKQIVDAWELVEKSGGLKACRKTLKIMDDINADKNGLIYKPFSEAVNLVEQCL